MFITTGVAQMSSRKTAKDFFESEDTTSTLDQELSNESVVNSETVPKLKQGKQEEVVVVVKDSKEETKSNEILNEKDTEDSTTASILPAVSYEQYVQQYQQYYTQYYSQYMYMPQLQQQSQTVDPAYELFSATGSTTTNSSSIPAAMSFDAGRANRQMSAYFDPTKFHSALSPEMQAFQKSQKQQQQARLSAKEIEAFKKKKIEKKKAKNRWFYE